MGDSSGDPGGSLGCGRGGGSHLHLPHPETGKEKRQSWWVRYNFPLNVYSSSCEIMFNQAVNLS